MKKLKVFSVFANYYELFRVDINAIIFRNQQVAGSSPASSSKNQTFWR